MSQHSADRFPPLLVAEGGPGAAFMRGLRIAPVGQGSARASVILALACWVPLFVASAFTGLLLGGAVIPFLYDLAAHVRFLIAIPVLVLAEIPIGHRLREVAAHFIDTGLVAESDEPRFADAIQDAMRIRDSRVAELVVLGAAYVSTYSALARTMLHGGSTWYAPEAHGSLTIAGWWYACVALPIFQFLIFRWIYRMFVWGRFLRRLAALALRVTPAHPDGAAGLGFLGKGCVPFGILLLATSAVIASGIAVRVLYAGAELASFRMAYGALLLVAIAVFTTPLLVFVPKLARAKRQALLEYGVLGSRYTRLFDAKWIGTTASPDEPLLGTGDIQSLADLGAGFERVKATRVLPIELRDFVAMAIPGVLPMIPLAATVMPLKDIAKQLLRLLA